MAWERIRGAGGWWQALEAGMDIRWLHLIEAQEVAGRSSALHSSVQCSNDNITR